MADFDKRIQYVIENTRVVRPPRQALATFGVTNIRYYLVTEPAYSGLEGVNTGPEETVVREGRVIAEKPKIVTPYYLANMFEGFEHGKEYAEFIMRRYGPHEPGLLYRYRNETGEISIVSGGTDAVVERLNGIIDSDSDHLSAIVKGVDDMWDVSLMNLVHDVAALVAEERDGSVSARLAEPDTRVCRRMRGRPLMNCSGAWSVVRPIRASLRLNGLLGLVRGIRGQVPAVP